MIETNFNIHHIGAPPKFLDKKCFSVENIGKGNKNDALYITLDANYNKLKFNIVNTTGKTLQFKSDSAKATAFLIDFSNMLSNDVVRNLTIQLPAGWDKKLLDIAGFYSWQFTCTRDKSLEKDEGLEFIIQNIVCTDIKPGNFGVRYQNIDGYDNLNAAYIWRLSALNPPTANLLSIGYVYQKDTHKVDDQKFIAGDITESAEEEKIGTSALPIYISYDSARIKNSFSIALTNGKQPIKLMPSPSPSKKPSITVSFLFGSYAYDITTPVLAGNNITADVESGSWNLSHNSGDNYWTFSTEKEQTIEPNKAIGAFRFNNLITPADALTGISNIYIQVNNFGGFDDATFIIAAEKLQPESALIDRSFTCSEKSIKWGENVRLSWISWLANRVTISYLDRDGGKILLDSNSTDPKEAIRLDEKDFLLPVTPSRETTQFLATPYPTKPGDEPYELSISVEQPLATIIKLTASPQLLQRNAKTEVTFSWEAKDAESFYIVSDTDSSPKLGRTVMSYKAANISPTSVCKLLAVQYGSVKDRTEKETQFFGYDYGPAIEIKLQAKAGAMQNRPAMAHSSRLKRIYVQNAPDSVVYEINTDNCSIVKKFPGDTFALNDAGTKLAVYSKELKGVILYDIATGAQSRAYNLHGTRNNATCLKFSPDGKRLYVVFNYFGSGIDEVTDDAEADEKNGPTYATYFEVNESANSLLLTNTGLSGMDSDIRSIAFNDKTSMVYFGSYTNTSLLLINYGDNRPATRGIDIGRQRKPVLLKGAKSESKLYVGIEDYSDVLVVDTNINSVVRGIPVGSYASDMVLSTDEKTLYVACLKENKVAVVNLADDKVFSYTLINSPSCLALSADEKKLFVGNYCDRTVTVIDLAKKEVISGTIPTGDDSGNPFGMTVLDTADGYDLFVAKEYYPARIDCGDKKKAAANLNVSKINIQFPKTLSGEQEQ